MQQAVAREQSGRPLHAGQSLEPRLMATPLEKSVIKQTQSFTELAQSFTE